PDAAVNADHAGAALDQLRRELFRRRTVEAGAILFRGHLRDDRQVTDTADRGDGRANLVQVAEGLEDEEIDLAVEERLCLIAEHGLRLIDAGLPPRLDANAERPDRPGHIRLALRLLDRAPRQLRAGHVDRPDLISQAEAAQLHAVRAEGVGFDDAGAGLQILAVHVHDQLGLRLIERLEAAIDEDALRVQHGAHGAIADEHTI